MNFQTMDFILLPLQKKKSFTRVERLSVTQQTLGNIAAAEKNLALSCCRT